MVIRFSASDLLQIRGKPCIGLHRSVKRMIFFLNIRNAAHQCRRSQDPREIQRRITVRRRSLSTYPRRSRVLRYLPKCERHAQRQFKFLTYGLYNIRSLNSKVDNLLEVVRDNNLDVLMLIETWHDEDSVCLRRLRAAGYTVIDNPRPRTRQDTVRTNHGGVAIIVTAGVHITRLELGFVPSTCEVLCVRLSSGSDSCILIILYRTGPVPSRFFVELSRILELFSVDAAPLILAGDLNIHCERPQDRHTRQLLETCASYGLECRVDQPTHRLGGTIDQVFARSESTFSTSIVDPCLSDHKLIQWKSALSRPSPTYLSFTYRPWKSLNIDRLRSVLASTILCAPHQWDQSSCDQLTETFGRTIPSAVDELVPLRSVRRCCRDSDPWFDGDCRLAKQLLRRIERHFFYGNLSQNDLELTGDDWRVCRKYYYNLLKVKRRYYWYAKVSSECNNQRDLWSSINSLMGRNRLPSSKAISPEDVLVHFSNKLAQIRDSTADSPAPEFSTTPGSHRLSHFPPTTPADVTEIVLSLPDKQSSCDVLPTRIMKLCIDLISPFIAFLINKCFNEGAFPSTLKLICVTPVIKKGCSDMDNISSYRPICNLPILSKVMEKMVAKHFVHYLNSNDLLNQLQSAYRANYSTETALLHITNDILCDMDDGLITLLASLDLSSAFDTVDHHVLLERLSTWAAPFGVTGLALQWFTSFICGRSMYYNFNGAFSKVTPVPTGIPQGSTLGPILFLLYVMDIIPFVRQMGLRIHVFADDIQVYGSCVPSKSASLATELTSAIASLDLWLRANNLLLNPKKTQFMWFGTAQRLRTLQLPPITVGDQLAIPATTMRCLGVVLDPALSLKSHVCRTISVCFGILRQIRTIRRSITASLTAALIHSLVFSRLDYCIGLLSGLPNCDISRLQSVINASARLVRNLPRSAHISPVLQDFQWLPAQERIELRLAAIAYKCLHGRAPSYLSRLLTQTADLPSRRHLRSASSSTLAYPKRRLKSSMRRPFSSAGPRAWNALPDSVRDCDTLASFKASARDFYLS